MEFVKKSLNVTDILIPEGDVIRITDKQTGSILWEKKKDLAPYAAWHSRILYDFAASLNTVPTEANGHRITFIANDTEYTGSNANQIALRIGYGSTGTAKGSTASFTGPRYNKSGNSSWNKPSTQANKPLDITTYTANSGGRAYLLACSDNGVIELFRYNGSYYVHDNHKNKSQNRLAASYDYVTGSDSYSLKINAPLKSETEVYIIYSGSRNEYLVTGITGGAFTIPSELSQSLSTQTAYSSKNIGRACWCSRDNLYYGALSDKAGYIAHSLDGYSWTEVKVFSSGSVIGVADLSTGNKLVALTSNKAALSTDGKIWTLKDVPFKSVAGYAYSSEHDLFCVADNSGKIYLTQKFNYWQELEAPANVKFKDFVHLRDGVFAGAAYQSDRVYILTTQKTIT